MSSSRERPAPAPLAGDADGVPAWRAARGASEHARGRISGRTRVSCEHLRGASAGGTRVSREKMSPARSKFLCIFSGFANKIPYPQGGTLHRGYKIIREGRGDPPPRSRAPGARQQVRRGEAHAGMGGGGGARDRAKEPPADAERRHPLHRSREQRLDAGALVPPETDYRAHQKGISEGRGQGRFVSRSKGRTDNG